MDRLIVQWLRDPGHDVRWAAEETPGASDPHVLQIAASDNRVLLTNDLDFGEHVFRNGLNAGGVIKRGA